ncbi:4-oxalocrotonate tautomerase [Tepidiphilus thermophilus]|jgi:4-oxalocrotonate tautomerase|nr:4-oxalocrotonate tautomerase [Tepidiphilus thermophilus]
MRSHCGCSTWDPSAFGFVEERGEIMPFVHIYILEGRTEEQKKAAIAKVTEALVESLGSPKENIRVMIQEVPKSQWGIGGVTAKDLGR